jgi:hypothetical protein
VTIYELRHKPATIGGALNIAPNAHRLMARLGVSPAHYGAPTPRVLFQNERGERIGAFCYGSEGDPWARGYVGMRVVRNDVQVNETQCVSGAMWGAMADDLCSVSYMFSPHL